MLGNSQIAVLERDTTFVEDFATEPFEAGWAGEALFFIHTLEHTGGAWDVRLQISPDGRHWCDDPRISPVRITGASLTALRATEFGVWLRLSCTGDSARRSVLRIHLVLK